MKSSLKSSVSSHKKKIILIFAMTWMELDGIILSEKSQSEKEK